MFPLQYPRHAPVVVSLGPDSDESDEDSTLETTSAVPFSLSGSLDLFLKEARQSVEVSMSGV